MKLTCPECKAVIAMADTDGVQERLQAKMEEHVAAQHGTLEQKHTKTLDACREAFSTIMMGGKLTKLQAAALHNQVSDLLGKSRTV